LTCSLPLTAAGRTICYPGGISAKLGSNGDASLAESIERFSDQAAIKPDLVIQNLNARKHSVQH
jgi:hypothetical protein